MSVLFPYNLQFLLHILLLKRKYFIKWQFCHFILQLPHDCDKEFATIAKIGQRDGSTGWGWGSDAERGWIGASTRSSYSRSNGLWKQLRTSIIPSKDLYQMCISQCFCYFIFVDWNWVDNIRILLHQINYNFSVSFYGDWFDLKVLSHYPPI